MRFSASVFFYVKNLIDASAVSTVKYYYDAAGRLFSRQTSNNAVGSAQTFAKTGYKYDNRGNLAFATAYDSAAVDSVTAYTYDATGHMLTSRPGMSSKTAGGHVTAYTYDRFGNVLTITDPLSNKETLTYSILGRLSSKTDRNGNVTAYTYDALGRVLTMSVTQPSKTADVTSYQYTLTGTLRQESNATTTISYTYDALARQTNVTETGGITKQYA